MLIICIINQFLFKMCNCQNQTMTLTFKLSFLLNLLIAGGEGISTKAMSVCQMLVSHFRRSFMKDCMYSP